VPVYGSNSDSLTGSNALKDKTLAPGARWPLKVDQFGVAARSSLTGPLFSVSVCCSCGANQASATFGFFHWRSGLEAQGAALGLCTNPV
jgi:hypothetical protein